MLTREFDSTKLRDQLKMKAVASKRPLNCFFELTYHCNFKCPMCYVRLTDQQAKKYGHLLSADEWLSLAKQAYDAGVIYLTLTGGECTSYPEFPRLYTELSKMGFCISLMSNAGYYTSKTLEVITKYPPHNVSITLYGGSNSTYEKVTGDPHGLDKVLWNIHFLQSLGIPLHINFTMIKQNAKDYPLVTKICQDLGLPFTLITDITQHCRDPHFSDAINCRLSPAERACIASHPADEIEIALRNAIELEKELIHFHMPVAHAECINETNACLGSYSSATIYWNGEMNTCISMAGSKSYKPLDIGFEKAWQKIQSDVPKRFLKSPICAQCDMQTYCINNCAARNFEGTGSFQIPDPVNCQYVWLLKEYNKNKPNNLITSIQHCN